MDIRKVFHMKAVVNVSCVIVCILSIVITSCGKEQVEIEPALQNITAYKFGDSREALSRVAELVTASYDFPSIRLQLEKQFVMVLESNATPECKEFICRQLWIIGTDVSVPVLAEMLLDETTSDMARYALENNPSPMAGKAFRDALESAQGKALIGVINSHNHEYKIYIINYLQDILFQENI